MKHNIILPIILPLLFLFACSIQPEPESTQPPNQLVAPPAPSATPIPAEKTVESGRAVASPSPTATLENKAGDPLGDQVSTDQPLQEGNLPEEYGVIASFHWLGLTTPTDITYNYEGWFSLQPDSSLQMVAEPNGYATGEAGVNFDNQCIEAVPVDIKYDFTITGKRLLVPITEVNPEVMMMHPDLVTGEDFQMFDLKFDSPEITSIDIPAFENCMPDADQEFLNNLGTYWISVIPLLSLEYRLVPAAEGESCPGVLSFNEEGLGSLEICYNIFLSQS
jgi:hypothetical protein